MLLCWVYEYLAFASTLFFNYDIIIIIIIFAENQNESSRTIRRIISTPSKKKLERIRYNIFEYDIFETSML